MKKLHNKDFSIAVKTGSDANKSKFAKEAVKGEAYYATDSQNLYFAQSTAGVSDALLSKLEPSESGYGNFYSVQYDGVNDYATLDSTISFSGEFTISTWLNLATTSGTGIFLGEAGSYIYMLYSGPNNRLTFVPAVGQSGINTPAISWNTSEWHHFMVTRDSSNTITLYVDGSSVQTASNSNTLQFRSFGQSNYYFAGHIDEYAVWDSDQSANIGDIRDSTLGTPKNLNDMSTKPLHWWRMGDDDGGTGTTITDQGSGGNNATLQNGPTFSTDVP